MAKSGNTYINKKVGKKNDLQNKAFVYRLKLVKWQEDKLLLFTDNTNYVWNHFLRINKRKLKGYGLDLKLFKEDIEKGTEYKFILNYFDMARELTAFKHSEKGKFLYGSSSESLQQKLKDLDKAIKEALDTKNDKMIPRFKNENPLRSFRSVTVPKIDGNTICMPRIGWLTFIKSREIEGTPKFATINKKGLHWYVSITTEGDFNKAKHPSRKKAGITRLGRDLQPRGYMTVSNGDKIEAPDPYKKYEDKLSILQKHLRKKTKGSNNWQKQKDKITKLHTKIANIRKDFVHKLSTKLTTEYKQLYFDKLNLKKLTEKGKDKEGYNKSILDKSWFEFTRQLEYKQLWNQGVAKEIKADFNTIKGTVTEVKIAKHLLSVGCKA